MSSAISATIRSRSSRERPISSPSRARISASTRLRTTSESETSNSRGPSSLTSARWILFLRSPKGSCALTASSRPPVPWLESRSCSSMSAPPRQQHSTLAATTLLLALRRGCGCCLGPYLQVVLGERPERPRRPRLRGRFHDRPARGQRTRDLAAARNEHVRAPPEQLDYVVLRDADAR